MEVVSGYEREAKESMVLDQVRSLSGDRSWLN